MSFHTWLIYLLAAIGLSLSPGPNSLLALTHGALHGRRKTLYTILGGAVGFVVVFESHGERQEKRLSIRPGEFLPIVLEVDLR